MLARDMSAFEVAETLVASMHMVTADLEAIKIVEVSNIFKRSRIKE